MVAIARAIIRPRTGTFDPGTYRDRSQEALRALIEAKLKGLPLKPRQVIMPPPVIDLMAALKRSLVQEMRLTGAITARESDPDPQAIGANERCFYPWQAADGRRRRPRSIRRLSR